MLITFNRVASLLAAVYVALVLGGSILRYLVTGDLYTLQYSLLLPATILASAIGCLVAWGLWRAFKWAYWLAVFATAVQLLRFGVWFMGALSSSIQPGIGVYLVALVLSTLLFVLALPHTRKACTR